MKPLNTYYLAGTIQKRLEMLLLVFSIFLIMHLCHLQGGPMEWIKNLQQAGYTTDKRKKLGILFTFWWFIWRERNRRFFYDKHKSFRATANAIQDQVVLNEVGLRQATEQAAHTMSDGSST
jgi:hypothetical protein